MNDIFALIITFVVAVTWLRINNYTAARGWISSQVSRKIIHMGTGPLFVACWLLFSDASSARYLAALVPLLITIQFILVGTGRLKDPSAVQAMSRTGDPKEILRGPLFYGIIFVLMTVIYWRDSPVGITALMLMCGGDGLADILGRRFGRVKLPWAKNKSWAGSFGMFLGGWLFAFGSLALFIQAGYLQISIPATILPLFLIALAGTAIESLPFHDIDNITVTGVAVLLGHLLF